MQKEELVEIIRKLVRQEVRSCLPQLIAEMALGSQGHKQTIQEAPRVSSQRTQVQKAPVKPAPKPIKKYSNNPVLNEVLSNTVPLEPDMESMSMAAMMEGETPTGDSEDNHIVIDPRDNLPHQSVGGKPAVRNYSDFLKKMDAAAKRTRPM